MSEGSVDLGWLLDAASRLPGDPDVTDYGSLVAAAARVDATALGRRVYDQPHHQAAALLQQLARIPALERANQLYAAAAAVAYLAACDVLAVPDLKQAASLAADAAAGRLDVREIAATLRSWTHGA